MSDSSTHQLHSTKTGRHRLGVAARLLAGRAGTPESSVRQRFGSQDGKESFMQFLFGVGLALAPMIAGTAPADDAGREPVIPLEVKVEGAVLAYVPREVPRAKRNPRGEIELIEEATAVLRVSRPLGFRRVSLDAGEYILRIESDEKRGHMLVLESRDGAEEKKERGASAPDRERSPRKGVERTAFGEGGGDPEPAGGTATKDAGASGPDPEMKPARARAPRKGAEAVKDAEAPRAAPLLRVPLTVSPREKSDDTLGFDLKVSGKGTKLRILIRAGSTEARASFRLGEPTKSP
jgi:hypothetical protein